MRDMRDNNPTKAPIYGAFVFYTIAMRFPYAHNLRVSSAATAASDRDVISEAAKVIGGRAKLAAALTNAPFDEVFNIHKPKPYRLGRAGERLI